MKAKLHSFFERRPFLRYVGMLVSGTALGQVIAIAALPVLTRLYEPEAFSILAVYVSSLTLVTVICCLRFEIAIPLPKSDRIAAALCVLGVASTIVFTVLTTLITVFFPNLFNKLTNSPISQFAWLMPIGVLAVGMYNSLQYWSTRKKNFLLISKTRVTQSVTGTAIKLGAGYIMGSWPVGLIFGQLVSQGSGFYSLFKSIIKSDWNIFKSLSFKHLNVAAIRYKRFPVYSTWEALANAGGIQIPIILIAFYSVGAEAGYIMLAMLLLSTPMSLVGRAVSQVYLSEGANRFHKGELRDFTFKTILYLSKIACIPLFAVALISPITVPYLLGEDWQRTGMLISWMCPWFFMQFITSPVSMVLHITDNQKSALLLQIFGLVLRVIAVTVAGLFFNDKLGEFFAVSSFIFYSIYLALILKLIPSSNLPLNIE